MYVIILYPLCPSSVINVVIYTPSLVWNLWFIYYLTDWNTVQLNLNFTHSCQYIRVLAYLLCVKLNNLMCTCTVVACNFGVCQWTHVMHKWCTSQTHTWFAKLHMWCRGTVDMHRQWNASVLQLGNF